MKEEKLLQEAAQKTSEILWKIVGTCIILATFVAVLFYMQQQKAKEAQMGHVPVYAVVSDEKAYREIAWDYAVESDIVYAWTEGKNGTEELLLDVYRTAKEGLNPAIILLHGGGLTTGDKASAGLLKSLATDFAGMGYVVVVPGCVIVHGTEDTTVRFSNSEKVESKLTRQGIDVKFYPLEGMNHDLLSRYDEVRNTVAEYLYQRLTGNDVTIDIKAEINPEYQKVLQRMENDMSFAADKSIGFSIAYNDGEGGDRQHQVGWTPGKSSDRTTLGTLYFK